MNPALTLLILVSLTVFLIWLAIKVSKKQKANLQSLNTIGELIGPINYVHGHPEINNKCSVKLGFIESYIVIIGLNNKIMGRIPATYEQNIHAEDAASFERRITLTRVALVGVFALLLKKRKKVELAFLSIDWTDGRFDHSTTFEYTGKNAMQRVNTDRNKILTMFS